MATAIFDVTHSCLESFDRVVAKHDSALLTHLIQSNDGAHRNSSPCDFLGIRNSFLFWIDYTGALSLVDSSLDARLQGLADISAVVMELLEMVLRSLRRLDTIPEHTKPQDHTTTEAELQYLPRWENACQAIESGLEELHFVALAIRKASAKRLDQMVTTSLTPEDAVFRKNVVTLVRYRFPAARKSLCQQLGESLADRRQAIIQSKRHAKKLAVRRTPGPSAHTKPQATAVQAVHPLDPKVVARIARRPSEVVSGMTKASRPDRRVLEIRQLQAPRPKALSTMISTISTSQEHSFDYPDLPQAKDGEVRVQCPFCFAPLERGGTEKKRSDAWKRHIDEHTKPYACLFPQCAKAMTFFTRRREWKAHMETTHSKDWLRKVHTMVWFCDIDHEEPVTFDTESAWRDHMRDLNSHPKRNLKAPTQAQLDALAPRKQQAAPRDALVCPLCEQIPDKVKPLVGNDQDNHFELHSQVIDHVADHLKSLSLMALPSLQDTQQAPELSTESVELMGDDFHKELNEGSIAQPPSGIELIDNASLPPEEWNDRTLDELEEYVLFDEPPPIYDPEFVGMSIQAYPTDAVETLWTGPWLSDTDLGHGQTWTSDPILSAFMVGWRSDEQDGSQLHVAARSGNVDAILHLLRLGADIEAQSTHDGTPLCSAALNGQSEAVQVLLDARAQVNTQTPAHPSPLIFALRSEENAHFDIVKRLLTAGAAPEARSEGETALVLAARKGLSDVVELLLSRGVSVDWGNELDAEDNSDHPLTALTAAAREGHFQVATVLLQNGAKISMLGKTGTTALCWAAREGHANIVQLLLNYGADVDVRDETYTTPLCWAAKAGNVKVIEELLLRSADALLSDGWSRSALYLGINPTVPESIAVEVARLLIDAGLDVNGTTSLGKTALHKAVKHRRLTTVQLLLDHGADIYAIDNEGRGAVFRALPSTVRNPAPAMLGLVLASGAHLEPANGLSPLVEAAKHGKLQVARELLEGGADIHRRDFQIRSGFTPLLNAAVHGQLDMVNFLVYVWDADINLACGAGNTLLTTILHLASVSQTEKSVSLAMQLVQSGARVNRTRRWKDPVEMANERARLLEENDLKNPGSPGTLKVQRLTGACGKCGSMEECAIGDNPSCFVDPEPLFSAVKLGDHDLVRLLLDKGAEVNAWSQQSGGVMATALMSAAATDDVGTARLLYNYGADVNAQYSEGPGSTALIIAIEKHCFQVVDFLLEGGADPNRSGHGGETALTQAVRVQFADSDSAVRLSSPEAESVVRKLLGRGALVNHQLDDGSDALMLAAQSGSVIMATQLLDAGADPRHELPDGRTAKAMADDKGYLELSMLLEVHGKNIYIADAQDRIQAHFWTSIEIGYVPGIRNSLHHGASITSWDHEYGSALHVAVRRTPKRWLVATIQELVDKGAPLGADDVSRLPLVESAVREVAVQGHAFALRALARANVNLTGLLTPIQVAVLKDDKKAAVEVLAMLPDSANATTGAAKFGAMWLAASFDDVEMVGVLLAGKAILQGEQSPFISLHQAANHNNAVMLDLLLEAGADPNGPTLEGVSPLRIFVQKDNRVAVDMLLHHGAEATTSDLVAAVRRGHGVVVAMLLAAGVDLHTADEEGFTPLHHAATQHNPDVMRLLLDDGADVNSKRFEFKREMPSNHSETVVIGNAPLHVAAWEGREEATEMLLYAGADPNNRGRGGKPPLHYAAIGGHIEVAHLLLMFGADVDARDDGMDTALTLSAQHSRPPEMVRFLLARGASLVSDEMKDLYSVLAWAVTNKHHDIVAFTMHSGAIDSFRDAIPRPGDRVSQALELKRIQNLIHDYDLGDAGVDLIKDLGLKHRLQNLGKLPVDDYQTRFTKRLFQAAEQNDVKAIETLLSAGIDPCRIDKFGKTPLFVAGLKKNLESVKLLVKAGSYADRHFKKLLSVALVSDQLMASALLSGDRNDINYTNHLEVADLLHTAVLNGSVQAVKMVLGAGLRGNLDGDVQFLAVAQGSCEIVELLAEAGLDLDVSKDGLFLLDTAVEKNDSDMVRTLLGAGATASRENMLQWAVRQGHADIVNFLCLSRDLTDQEIYRAGSTATLMSLADPEGLVARLLKERGKVDDSLLRHPGMRARLVMLGKIPKEYGDSGTAGERRAIATKEDGESHDGEDGRSKAED